MSQLQIRIDDEQVLSLQLQKKIKELQVKVAGSLLVAELPARAQLALSRSSFPSSVIICGPFLFFFLLSASGAHHFFF